MNYAYIYIYIYKGTRITSHIIPSLSTEYGQDYVHHHPITIFVLDSSAAAATAARRNHSTYPLPPPLHPYDIVRATLILD